MKPDQHTSMTNHDHEPMGKQRTYATEKLLGYIYPLQSLDARYVGYLREQLNWSVENPGKSYNSPLQIIPGVPYTFELGEYVTIYDPRKEEYQVRHKKVYRVLPSGIYRVSENGELDHSDTTSPFAVDYGNSLPEDGIFVASYAVNEQNVFKMHPLIYRGLRDAGAHDLPSYISLSLLKQGITSLELPVWA